jgi:putative salt-induced outer membrane protein YdiY
VVELAQSSESFWRRFSGNIDLGLMYSRGNDTTQYNTSGQLKFRTEYWRVEANYASSLSKSTGVDASTRNQSNIWARRLVGGKRKWFYTGSSALLQSSQQGIDLQTTLGGGAGRFLKDTNFARIAVTAGLAVQRTNYTEHLGVQSPPNALASFVAGDVNLFKFKKTSFDASVNMLPVLSQAGRVQTNVNSAYSIQVISNFWLRLSFYGSWDNRPPAHFSGSDYGVSSSISYKFN